MNGLSDVRLKVYGGELERVKAKSLVSVTDGMSGLGLMVHRWKTRRALLELTADQLKDIGLSRADAIEEGLKPFWRS